MLSDHPTAPPPAQQPSWLSAAIHDLATIADAGQLDALVAEFSAACRPVPPLAERQRQTRRPTAAREIAQAASHLLGLPVADCERIAVDALSVDRWTAQALDLIREYRTEAVTDGRPIGERLVSMYQSHGLDAMVGGGTDDGGRPAIGDAAERASERIQRMRRRA
jgi:hypothetical protein